MITEHQITPPLDLVHRWVDEARAEKKSEVHYVARKTAQWASDQELEECCEWLSGCGCESYGRELRGARRPKNLSRKEQALESLNKILTLWMTNNFSKEEFVKYGTTVRSALETLPNG
jgi:hypothetical protein